jgi:hypothetical protein
MKTKDILRAEFRMVRGYELRIIGLMFFALAPILYCPPLELPLNISYLTLVMGLFCTMLGVAQKKRAEKNGGTVQFVWAAAPSLLICLAVVFVIVVLI